MMSSLPRPGGTGKTYLAVATAVAALRAEKVRKLVLVRPAVEAGESLGFCPAICRPDQSLSSAADGACTR